MSILFYNDKISYQKVLLNGFCGAGGDEFEKLN